MLKCIQGVRSREASWSCRLRVSKGEREFWVNAMCGISEAVVIGEILKMFIMY